MSHLDYNLKDKVAFVTGGSHGIGFEITKLLGNYGCKVIFCSRTIERLNQSKEILDDLNIENYPIQFDALNAESCINAHDLALKKYGRIDILINNVGGGGRWGKEKIEETDLGVWTDVFNKNAKAAIIFTKKFIPVMRKNKWGRVITITSKYGKEGGGRPWFNLAKASEVSLMKSLSMIKYLVRDGITFNSVAPGSIYIPGTGYEKEKNKDEIKFRENIDKYSPMGRMGKPEEVAYLVAFLCSEMASFINGAQICIDGGETASF